jgi:hypothetical protein
MSRKALGFCIVGLALILAGADIGLMADPLKYAPLELDSAAMIALEV